MQSEFETKANIQQQKIEEQKLLAYRQYVKERAAKILELKNTMEEFFEGTTKAVARFTSLVSLKPGSPVPSAPSTMKGEIDQKIKAAANLYREMHTPIATAQKKIEETATFINAKNKEIVKLRADVKALKDKGVGGHADYIKNILEIPAKIKSINKEVEQQKQQEAEYLEKDLQPLLGSNLKTQEIYLLDFSVINCMPDSKIEKIPTTIKGKIVIADKVISVPSEEEKGITQKVADIVINHKKSVKKLQKEGIGSIISVEKIEDRDDASVLQGNIESLQKELEIDDKVISNHEFYLGLSHANAQQEAVKRKEAKGSDYVMSLRLEDRDTKKIQQILEKLSKTSLLGFFYPVPKLEKANAGALLQNIREVIRKNDFNQNPEKIAKVIDDFEESLREKINDKAPLGKAITEIRQILKPYLPPKAASPVVEIAPGSYSINP